MRSILGTCALAIIFTSTAYSQEQLTTPLVTSAIRTEYNGSTDLPIHFAFASVARTLKSLDADGHNVFGIVASAMNLVPDPQQPGALTFPPLDDLRHSLTEMTVLTNQILAAADQIKQDKEATTQKIMCTVTPPERDEVYARFDALDDIIDAQAETKYLELVRSLSDAVRTDFVAWMDRSKPTVNKRKYDHKKLYALLDLQGEDKRFSICNGGA